MRELNVAFSARKYGTLTVDKTLPVKKSGALTVDKALSVRKIGALTVDKAFSTRSGGFLSGPAWESCGPPDGSLFWTREIGHP